MGVRAAIQSLENALRFFEAVIDDPEIDALFLLRLRLMVEKAESIALKNQKQQKITDYFCMPQ